MEVLYAIVIALSAVLLTSGVLKLTLWIMKRSMLLAAISFIIQMYLLVFLRVLVMGG